jgi:hypothetical protein
MGGMEVNPYEPPKGVAPPTTPEDKVLKNSGTKKVFVNVGGGIGCIAALCFLYFSGLTGALPGALVGAAGGVIGILVARVVAAIVLRD